jgi:hypothetical protein
MRQLPHLLRVAIVVLLAGILGDRSIEHGLPLLDGSVLRLDGAFSLLLGLVLGPAAGVITAILATLRTAIEAGSSQMVVLAAGEVLCVVALVRRRRWQPVLATVAYWLLIGWPFILVVQLLIQKHDPTSVTLVMAKQPLNSLVNTVIATLLAAQPAVVGLLRGAPVRGGDTRLKQQIFHTFLPLAVVPVLFLGFGLGRVFAQYAERQELTALNEHSYRLARQVADYVREHEDALASAALLVESTRSPTTRAGSSPDRRASTIAASPSRTRAGAPWPTGPTSASPRARAGRSRLRCSWGAGSAPTRSWR